MLTEPFDLIQKYKDLLTGTKWKAIKSDEAEHDDSIIKFRTRGSRDGLQAKVINNNGESSGWYTAGVRADGEISFFSDASTTWEGTVGSQGQYISFNLQEMYVPGDVGNSMNPYIGLVIAAPVGNYRTPAYS